MPWENIAWRQVFREGAKRRHAKGIHTLEKGFMMMQGRRGGGGGGSPDNYRFQTSLHVTQWDVDRRVKEPRK